MDTQLLEMNSTLLYCLVAVFSLTIGSLLNVVIYRLPQMLKNEWVNECRSLSGLPAVDIKPVNLFFPRSFCPQCNTQIKAIHNIPVLSYLFLRGKCANCQQPVSMRYPLVELLTCLLSTFAAWHFGFNLTLVYALLFIWLTIPMLFIDLDEQLLPDCLTLGLLWLGLIANTQSLFTTLPNAVISAAIAYLALWFFIKLYYLLTGKIGMGNGDFKLFAAFGAWFGWTQLPLILLLSSITGAIGGLMYLKLSAKSNDTPIAFGPFLCVSGLIALFWGKAIINAYLHFAGL
ncbi:prepilin peptidase [Legionella dresdenensis]|uniref:Prepilin leader peptidase/N-methyltransferase n=1 Tax=Legionella dresdenensis TaxID=450200 RepID=A0ABV8CC84_9GAMM